MPATLSEEALAPLRADPARAAILLDIDGTLAPIVERAAEARVPEQTRQLVKQIANRYGLVAAVSGRRASEARAMVSIGTISYLGSHGAELLRAGWTEPVLDPAVEDWARRVQEFAHELDATDLRRHRVRVEDKGAIVAFHWRGAPDEDAAKAAADAIAARAQSSGLRTHWGRKVLEVRPPVKIDKGSGIALLLDGVDIDAALYAGDDHTDFDAFRMLAELALQGGLKHAVRVGVRSDEGPDEIVEEADVIVDGTAGVRKLLEFLAAPGDVGVRFVDFLRMTVLISAGAASALAAVTVAGAAGNGDSLVVPVAAGWWVTAALVGIWLGRRADASPPIATLLASARMQTSLPEVSPARTALNRLWPLLFSTIGAGALAFALPQVPAVATGFAIIWSLAWRRQASAVTAIEERDGARFYVERTSPVKPIQLVRTPGFRTNLFELNGRSRHAGSVRPRA